MSPESGRTRDDPRRVRTRVTPFVIDASAGVEILANTAHGRRLAQLLPTEAVGDAEQDRRDAAAR
jgi:hypothetical protein